MFIRDSWARPSEQVARRHLLASLCLLIVLLAAGGQAAADTPPRAPPVSGEVPAAGDRAAPDSEVQLHRKRVLALQAMAKGLASRCGKDDAHGRTDESDARAILSRAVTAIEGKIAELASRATALAKGVDDLEDRIKKAGSTDVKQALERERTGLVRKLREVDAALKALPFTSEKDGSRGPDKCTLRKTIDQGLNRFRSVVSLTTKPPIVPDADKVCGGSDEPSDRSHTTPSGICMELCSAGKTNSSSGDTVVDLCAFADPVLANAAVLADWASVDALLEYAGAPRKILEEKLKAYALVAEELPIDPFPGPREGRKKTDNDVTKADKENSGRPSETNLCDSVDDPNKLYVMATARLGAQAAAGSAARATVAAASGLGGLDLSLASAQTAELALASLARVIEDRAKRESLVWFLQQLQEHVCGSDREMEEAQEARRQALQKACKAERDAADDARAEATRNRETAEDNYRMVVRNDPKLVILREVRTFWLPTTCALARDRTDYVQFGGGAALLRALQGAIASDVRAWPGIAAGLGLGAAFWLDTASAKPVNPAQELPQLFLCDHDAANPGSSRCKATRDLRDATTRLVLQLQGGADASASLYGFAAEIDALNDSKQADRDLTRKLYSDGLQLAACVMSLPRVFHGYVEHVRATTSDRKEEVEALMLAGLGGAPACWTAVGEGWAREDCPGFKAGSGAQKTVCEGNKPLRKALERSWDIERLTTILRWYHATGEPADRVVAQWGTLKGAWETYLGAFETYKRGSGAWLAPPPFDVEAVNKAHTFDEVAKAFAAYGRDSARAAQQTQLTRLLQASAALGKASMDFGVVLTDGLSKSLDHKLYPGIKSMTNASEVKAALQATGKDMARFSGHLATAEMALTQDWGAAVARVVAIVRTDVVDQCKKAPQCSHLMERLSRYSGLFSALISEKDPEKVAEALDAAATPIGGWRNKQIPDAFTISLTAFPGFGVGFIERRWGQYGAVREHGDNNYLAPPTLQMPVGIDFAWGWKKCAMSSGFFLSLLDPAAYLQWDPDNGGRLPGAQLLTALAPGAALRFSLGPTPFVATVYGVFRPNFRAWEPDIAAPAAHALQIGASLAVDVTLFELHAKRN